jgi:hypothetical protein
MGLDGKDGKIAKYIQYLIWWQIDQDEINKQVTGYNTLKIYQSARGIGFLLFIFSASVTFFMIMFANSDIFNLVDVIMSLTIGYFMYKGRKWAMVFAMVFWSIEKFYMIYERIQSATQSSSFTGVMMQIVYWAIFMHVFFLAYKVESARIKENLPRIQNQPVKGTNISPLDELERLNELKNRGVITEDDYNFKKKQILNL